MNRQDRYIEFNNKSMVDFFSNLAETIGEPSWEDHNGKLSKPDRDCERLNEDLIQSFDSISKSTDNHHYDTVFYPNVQAGWSNVNIEVRFLNK